MPDIVIIEDDAAIRKLVCYALDNDGYTAHGFDSAEAFHASDVKADLLILDIMLPDEDGISILKKIRARGDGANLPVMMLTAKGNEYDKVEALDLGADDYMTKPFGVMELLARVKALLRRAGRGLQPATEDAPIEIDKVRLDPGRRTVEVDGREVHFTYKEFELLHYLMLNKGLALSRDQLLAAVWGFAAEGESRTVDMHIRLLRQKLGSQDHLIQTVRGVGYKLEAGVQN